MSSRPEVRHAHDAVGALAVLGQAEARGSDRRRPGRVQPGGTALISPGSTPQIGATDSGDRSTLAAVRVEALGPRLEERVVDETLVDDGGADTF